jgi:Arylsulfotransferase (ASST)
MVWGSIAARTKMFPDRLLIGAYRGWQTWQHRSDDNGIVKQESSAVGVLRYDPEHAYNGYTLFTSEGIQGAFLIDMNGRIVHEWYLPYRAIWNKSAAVTHPVPAKRIHWRRAYLYPNGDLLAVYEAPGFTPWGYGLAKMDRNSRPIWTYLAHVHHDVDVGPDGKVYTLTQDIRKDPFPDLPDIPMPVIEDFVVVLSPGGKVLKKISIYEAFAKSSYRRVMELITSWHLGDQIHTNAIKVVTPDIASRFPFAHVGEVLLSFRRLDGIALLDLDTQKIEWFLSGPWRHQHDPQFLDNGHMLIFDNDGGLARGGRARVLEFDPRDLQIFWQYPGADGDPNFDSPLRGSEQLLPNGNVLITESDAGELVEVTRDDKIVWEYRNPFKVGPHHKPAGWLLSGHRFGIDDLHFEFNGSGHIPGISGGN